MRTAVFILLGTAALAGCSQRDQPPKSLTREDVIAIVNQALAEERIEVTAPVSQEATSVPPTVGPGSVEWELANLLAAQNTRRRVEEIRQTLETEGLWTLSPLDLEFATGRDAGPLLALDLSRAAGTYNEQDALDRACRAIGASKLRFAMLHPRKRQSLAVYALKVGRSEPLSADDLIRLQVDYKDAPDLATAVIVQHLRVIGRIR